MADSRIILHNANLLAPSLDAWSTLLWQTRYDGVTEAVLLLLLLAALWWYRSTRKGARRSGVTVITLVVVLFAAVQLPGAVAKVINPEFFAYRAAAEILERANK